MPHSRIRHLDAARATPLIAAAEFESSVSIWDVETGNLISCFDTPMDFGGRRLAISADGEWCACGSYNQLILVVYHARTGHVAWERRGLDPIQRVRISVRQRLVYAYFEDRFGMSFDLASGETRDELIRAEFHYESPSGRLVALDRPPGIELHISSPRRRCVRLRRKTFAALDVALSDDLAILTESGGPISCYSAIDGTPSWEWAPGDGVHALRLSIHEGRGEVLAVIWPYQHGGASELVALDTSTGHVRRIFSLGDFAVDTCFVNEGDLLVSSQGEVTNTLTGNIERRLAFPFSEA